MLIAGSLVSVMDPSFAADVAPLLLVIGHATAGALYVRRVRAYQPVDGRAWMTLALALWCGAGGVLVVGGLTLAGVEVGAFSPVDLIFLTGYVAMILGLVQLARTAASGHGWIVTLVDTAVGAVALATFVWVGVGHDLYDALKLADPWSRAIAPLYPIVDIAVVVGVMAMALRRTAFRMEPRLIALALGLGTQVFADLAYFSAGAGKSFADVSPRFDLFLFASACYVAVGVIDTWDRAPREFPDRNTSVWAMLGPYGLGTGLVVMHITGLYELGVPTDSLVTMTGSLMVGLLVIVRQGLAIREVRGAVDRQRRDLISSVSHELRTPLTGLLGYLELLSLDRSSFSESELDEMLRTASGEALHLSRTITDMVALARDDADGLAISRRKAPLGEVCSLGIRRSGVADVRLELVDNPVVEVDPDRLGQAVMNLVSNADKYGRGTITVRAAGHLGRVRIEVHDDGPGVPVRHQERIWEQFERGAHRLNATTPGSGVGLSVVRAVARAHGGTVAYQRSRIHGGGCFVIEVPARPPDVMPAATPATELPAIVA